MTGERVVPQLDYQRVEIGARIAALVLVFSLSVVTGSGDEHLRSLFLLAVLAGAVSVPVSNRTVRYWRPVAESLIAGLLIATSEPYDPALLPYLVVPSLTAGLRAGWRMAFITSGTAAFALLTRGLVRSEGLATTDYLVDLSQWILLSLAVGQLAAWLRRVQTQRPSDTQSYAQAARLLGQLRDVSRQLSGGLDAVGLAQGQLIALRETARFDRGWVFSRTSGDLLLPLATDALEDMEWEPEVQEDGIWSRTMRGGEPHRANAGFAGDPSSCSVVLPMRVDSEVVGLVGLERRGDSFSLDEIAASQRALDGGAVRIDAALLFNDVRSLATTEERQRLAREIHDGIAQELASMGYVVDELAARTKLGQPEVSASLRELRAELTRVISELRLSIFDLRREIGPGMSLVSALSDHVRLVGATSGLTVHLELDESPRRLRVETETELLRIAQEAIANARRHANAQNLWVTCRVDPPSAELKVEDDGQGMASGSDHRFGLQSMRERAERIGGELQIAQRSGGGTRVLVTTGSRTPASEGRADADPRATR